MGGCSSCAGSAFGATASVVSLAGVLAGALVVALVVLVRVFMFVEAQWMSGSLMSAVLLRIGLLLLNLFYNLLLTYIGHCRVS